MVRNECGAVFNSWCEGRSCVVKAPGTPRQTGMVETYVASSPRKGKRAMKKKVLVVPFALLFAPLFAHAQGLGSIVGRVTDPSGAAVASARVVATQEGTAFSRTAVTDTEGLYVIPALRPATYILTVEAAGFNISKENGINLLADQTLTVNFGLRLGTTTEIIEISGNALQADTSTSTLKQVIEQQRLVEMPLEGRNAAKLSLLVPGTVYSVNGGADQGTTKTFPGAVTISANGARQDMVSYLLDGGNYVDEYTNVNQPFPFPDALQEFSVQTSNYSAEYGQNAGAVVNVITKSGTNHFHGDVFEFLRNAVFNARSFFAPIAFKDMGRDQLKRNQFGGTIGGPIIHDKTFFFAGFQGTRLRNVGNPTNSTVPSQADITAFTASGGTIDPTVANLLPLLPIQPTSRSVTFVRPDKQNFNEVLGKVDHAFSQNDRLSVRYDFNYFSRAAVFVPTNILTYADGSKITNQNWLIHETHVFRPSLLNDLRFSYAREKASRGPASTVPSVQSLGSMIPFQPRAHAIQQIRVNGFFSFGDNPQASFVRNNFTWSDDVSWVKGKHDFRFGGVLERSRVDLNNLFFQPAEFSFPSLSAFLSGKLGDYSGNFAFRQGAGEFKNNRNIFAGVYVQDNYRVTRRLTLNLGLRYEPAFPWSDTGNRWAQVNLAAMAAGTVSRVYPNAPPGVFFSAQNGIASDPGMPKNALNTSWTGFAPRLGFAYDVFGDGKTSLRGGAGIFYDTRVMGMLSNRFVDEWPFSPQFILSTASSSAPTAASSPGSFSDPLCTNAATQAALNCSGAQAASYPKFPSPFPAPTNFGYIPPFNEIAVSYDPGGDYHVPTTYEWNLTVERQLPSHILFRIAYIGSRTLHILETEYYNPAVPAGIAGCPNSTSAPGKAGTGLANCTVFLGSGGKFKTNTFSSTVQADITDVNASYHSLQTSVEKRMSHGLTVLANYTYSKSLDDLPFGEGVSGFDNGYSTLPFNAPGRHRMDYGPSGFDHTHVFTASYVWHSPGVKSSSTLLR